ncbi:uncharacterized protein LOC116851599 [Odontomachus brunneus]|uniref:uncharacterized protein LOC116851599 n=1 Tax=Odontomachus brunneus TaxID=486640 RepID=UPI0013F1E971|nr:uncharacterized protein LOC116851599 [Odontomachus brunneus]
MVLCGNATRLQHLTSVANGKQRPLSPLTEDSDDVSGLLTLGHFLIGKPLNTVPEPNLTHQLTSQLTRWQLFRQKVEHFWKIWSSECLQRYQSISKWHHFSNLIQEGSLVLLIDERYPSAKWSFARVQLHPGTDGLMRVVTVHTTTSTLTRPIAKLYILPVASHEKVFSNSVFEGRNVEES